MPSETQFTPLGPAAVGFQTDGANIDVGGDIGGNKVGGKFNCISGSAIEAISDPDNISSSNLAAVVGTSSGTGVRGNGLQFGVFGQCNSPEGAGVSGSNEFGDGVLANSGEGDIGDLYVRSVPDEPPPKNEAQLFFCLGKDGPEGKSGRSVWVPVSFGAAVLGNA